MPNGLLGLFGTTGHGHGGVSMPTGHIMAGLSAATIAKFFPDYPKHMYPKSAKKKSTKGKR